MRVAIIGGGASAHLLAVLLSCRGHSVRIMTSRPDEWSQKLELETYGEVIVGNIEGATSDPCVALKGADVAFLCMPVHQYPAALQRVIHVLAGAPKCIVGAVYGQAGFDWMVKSVCRRTNIPVIPHFAIGLLPWIARTKIYGKRSISFGPKFRNGIATSDMSVFEYLQENILDDISQAYWGCGKFERVPNFLTLTLTVDNQIIHPSRCFGLAKKCSAWRRIEDVPYFYKDFDEYSASILKGVDDDYTCIREAYARRFPCFDSPYNLNYLDLEHWSYGSHNPDIKASFVNSKTLHEIKTPVIECDDGAFRLDVNNRFFKDDFAFGLEIANWFARRLDCSIPHIEALLNWYVNDIKPRQKNMITSATPDVYGIGEAIMAGEIE